MRNSFLSDLLVILIAVSAAFLIYSLLGAALLQTIYIINIFSIIVIVGALKKGGLFGAFLGTGCGLVQDSFSFGVFGVAGLTKTILGFAAGTISRRIDVAEPGRNFVFIVILSGLEVLAWVLLVALARRQKVNFHQGLMLIQPLVTAVVSGLLVQLVNKIERQER